MSIDAEPEKLDFNGRNFMFYIDVLFFTVCRQYRLRNLRVCSYLFI